MVGQWPLKPLILVRIQASQHQSPSTQKKCSILLKRTNAPITYLNDVKSKINLNKNEKAPIKDEP